MSDGIGAINFKLGEGRAASPWSPERKRLYCELDRLWKRGRELLGCEIAIMGGAMTWVSERNLVAAISNAGGFGVIASGSMSPELLSLEIGATKAMTTRPFGVNLITLHPQLLELIDVCTDHRVDHVVLAGGLPSSAAVARIKQGGARVVCFAPALGFARKLVRMGVDAIVIEGNEAGGHIGPVSTGVLAQEILPHKATPEMRAIAHIKKKYPGNGSRRAGAGNFEVLVGPHAVQYIGGIPQAAC